MPAEYIFLGIFINNWSSLSSHHVKFTHINKDVHTQTSRDEEKTKMVTHSDSAPMNGGNGEYSYSRNSHYQVLSLINSFTIFAVQKSSNVCIHI